MHAAAGSLLDRSLRLFSDVRPKEGLTAVLLTANVFLILTSYYLLKTLREPLILAGGGAEVKSYAAAGQAVLLLGLVPAYAVLATRLPRRRLINVVVLFFVACMGAFYALAKLGVPVGVPFFLWVGIFNLMIIAQFWGFANDLYSVDEGKRLFPIVAFGASAGAVFGSWSAGRLIERVGLDPLFLAAAAVLLASLVLTNIADARERRARESHLPAWDTTAELPAATGEFSVATTAELRAAKTVEEIEKAPGAFQLVFRNRYLLLIALLLLVLNWVNTTGEYILGRTVSAAAADAVAAGRAGGLTEAEFIGAFYASFFAVVNLLGLGLQLFVVSRVLKYAGVAAALLFLPVIALAGYAILAFFPLLAAVRWAKTAENATDYSLQNTVRNVLFLPTTREEKYKAKQAIDGFFVRAGDVLSAGVVFVGVELLRLQTRGFALVNLGLVAVWLLLAVWIGREYRRAVALTGDRGGAEAPAG